MHKTETQINVLKLKAYLKDEDNTVTNLKDQAIKLPLKTIYPKE